METITKPTVTTEIAKSQINVALTRSNLLLQNIQNEADNLVVNEDHLQEVADFIRKTKQADKVIDEKHEEGKRPHLEAGRNWDAAKNDLKGMIAGIRKKIEDKYTALCQDIERRKQQALMEASRKRDILSGIENNVIQFSSKIANCNTAKELLAVESVINLEKSSSRAFKYGEFHQQAIDKYEEVLKPIIVRQKAKIKELEELEKQRLAAEKKSDVEAMDALQSKQETVRGEIQQNKINVQEAALTQTPIPTYETANVVYPTVKPRRTTFKWRVDDINLLAKKMPHLVKIIPNDEAITQLMKSKKTDGTLKEESYFGITFYEEKLY